MNFMLCQSFLNVDTLFKCFQPSQNSVREDDQLKLEIDKSRMNHPYALDKHHSRITHINSNLEFLNNVQRFKEVPGIFLHPKTKGRQLEEVLHPLVVPFYKNIAISTLNEKQMIKLHIVLNGTHLLITSLPIFDKNNKIIAVTLIETPYTSVQDALS